MRPHAWPRLVRDLLERIRQPSIGGLQTYTGRKSTIANRNRPRTDLTGVPRLHKSAVVTLLEAGAKAGVAAITDRRASLDMAALGRKTVHRVHGWPRGVDSRWQLVMAGSGILRDVEMPDAAPPVDGEMLERLYSKLCLTRRFECSTGSSFSSSPTSSATTSTLATSPGPSCIHWLRATACAGRPTTSTSLTRTCQSWS